MRGLRSAICIRGAGPSAVSSIPLPNRVPNLRAVRVAPELVAELEAAHCEEPTLFVVGEGSAPLQAAFAAVHSRGLEQLSRAVFLDAGAGAAPLDALLHAIACARGFEPRGRTDAPRRDIHEFVETVIDAADAPGIWVVVKARDAWDPDLTLLAHAASKYARLARWTFVARTVPEPASGEPPPCVLEVDPGSVTIVQRAPSLPPRADSLVPQAPAARSGPDSAPPTDGAVESHVPNGVPPARPQPPSDSVDGGLGAARSSVDGFLAALEARLDSGESQAVLQWADPHAERLFDEGHAPELAERLSRAQRPELWALAARACIVAHDSARLEALAVPDEPCAPEVRLAIAEREFFFGQALAALEHARAAADTAKHGILRASASALAGRLANICLPPDDAERLFEHIERTVQGTTLEERAVVAAVRVLGGDASAVARLVAPIVEELCAAGSTPARRILDALLYSFIFADRIDLGLVVYERWIAGARRFATPEFLYIGAFLCQQNGQIERSTALIERFAGYVRGRNIWARGVRYLRAREAFAIGNLAGLDANVATLEAESLAARDTVHYVVARNLRMRIDFAYGRPFPTERWPVGLRVATQRHEGSLRIERELPGDPEPNGRHAVIRTIAAGLFAAAGGNVGSAWAALDDADARLRGAGIEVDRAELACMRALLALATGDTARLPTAVAVLAEAARWPSAMHAGEANLYASLAVESPDFALLERACCTAEKSPRAARLAHLLLGGAVPEGLSGCLTGPLEIAAVRALSGRWGGAIRTISRGPTDAPGWGFDARRLLVWRHDGDAVPLAGAPTVVALLQALIDAPRGASKEELAVRVWQVPDFHPLRDAKRMQVAVRKLRTLVEADPGRPVRIVTIEGGYAIGEREPARTFAPA